MGQKLEDPRQLADFNETLFPQCDGDVFPRDVDEANQRYKLRLLSCYYHLNVAYDQLCRFRKDSTPFGDGVTERQLLQQVESALISKEATEDELTEAGMCATPTLKEGRTINLEFCEPGSQAVGTHRIEHSATVHVELQIPNLPPHS